jgi:hypothetical protein
MLPIIVCVAVPALVIGLIGFLRYLYGDSIFGLNKPVADLNNPVDYRLVKLRLNGDTTRTTPQAPGPPSGTP